MKPFCKGKLARLVPAIERELREAIERSTRRNAEQALRESEKRFRSLIENASDIITILDAGGVIRYGSPAIERVLGYKPEDLIGEYLFKYIHPDDVPYVSAVSHKHSNSQGLPSLLSSVLSTVTAYGAFWKPLAITFSMIRM